MTYVVAIIVWAAFLWLFVRLKEAMFPPTWRPNSGPTTLASPLDAPAPPPMERDA